MSARSLNKVMLIGNLTRDPELKYTPQGTAVVTFGVATNRQWTPSDGGPKQEDTQFHRIVAWSKLAEICDQLLFKGRKVFIEGRLQTRKWTTQDGQTRESTEVVAENMVVLDNRQKGQSGSADEDFDVADVEDVESKGEDDDSSWVEEVGEDAPSSPKSYGKKSKSNDEESEEEQASDEVSADEIPF